jgi:DNA end-binding protein Ku
VSSPKIPKETLEVASHVLDTKAGHLGPPRFKDEFEIELRKLVRGAIEYTKRLERPGNLVDRMTTLRQSVRSDQRLSPPMRELLAGDTRAVV